MKLDLGGDVDPVGGGKTFFWNHDEKSMHKIKLLL